MTASAVITGDRLLQRGRAELVFGSALAAIASGSALMLAALGAARALVMRTVLGDAVKLAAWGVADGLGLACLWKRVLLPPDASPAHDDLISSPATGAPAPSRHFPTG